MKSGHCSHGADKDSHRMSVIVESAHQLCQPIMDKGVVHDLVAPLCQLRLHSQLGQILHLCLGGQLAVYEKVGNFKKAALFCQLLDGVATILEDAVITVNVAYL